MDKIVHSTIYKEDLEKVFQSISNIEILKNKSFFITGCNCLICSVLVDFLLYLNEKYAFCCSLVLAARDIEKTKSRFSQTSSPISVIKYKAEEKLCLEKSFDYYIHGASNSSPDLYITEPVETMMGNIEGIYQILDNVKSHKSRVLYISSSEVYGEIITDNPIKENDMGIINYENLRSSYSLSKRTSELLCRSFYEEKGVDCVIVRPGHIYGPTAKENDNRVVSQFFRDVLNNKNLILKSSGEQKRSYTYVMDCISQLVNLLINGVAGEAYNISNPKSIISIKEMAGILAEIGNVKVLYNIRDKKNRKDNPMNNSSLSSEKVEKLLGSIGIFTKYEGFLHTYNILKSIK